MIFNQPTYRGMRINWNGSLPGPSSTGGQGIVGPEAEWLQ
jgi:hypothetical protein